MMKFWNLNLALLFPTTNINLSYFVKSQMRHIFSFFFRIEIQYSSNVHGPVIKMPTRCTLAAKRNPKHDIFKVDSKDRFMEFPSKYDPSCWFHPSWLPTLSLAQAYPSCCHSVLPYFCATIFPLRITLHLALKDKAGAIYRVTLQLRSFTREYLNKART